jgi:hypothetical protein
MSHIPRLKGLMAALLLSAALPSSATIIVSANTTWNSSFSLTDNVEVRPGATLTISGSSTVITCSPGVYIKVQTNITGTTAGGRLVINDATLTAAPNSEWYGIYTVGDKTISQQDVRMSKTTLNRATIEKAMYGVRNWDYQSDLWAYTTGGGIVQVNNSKFHNNSFGVYLHSYQNFSKINPSIKMADYSYVNKSNFYFDNTTNLAGGGGSCIHMHDVDGIRIQGNTFYRDPLTGWAGTAIYIENSGAIIQPYCNDNIILAGQPCNNETPNSISGFWRGIYAPGTGGVHNVRILKSQISSTTVGIYMQGYQNTMIQQNTISLAASSSSGITLEGCSGFKVEENVIHGTSTTSSNATYGITIKNSGESYNEVYKNEIVNTNYALQANDNNRSSTNPANGLMFLCNTMTNAIGDAYDLTVNVNGTLLPTSGIAYIQAGFNGNPLTAGNTFSNFTTTTNYHNFNNAGNGVLYYTDPAVPATMPTYNNVTIMNVGGTNTCPTKIIPPGSAVISMDQLSTAKVSLETAIDGHITAGEDYSTELAKYRLVISEMINRYSGTVNGEETEIYPDAMISLLGSAKYLYDFKVMKAEIQAQYGAFDEAMETMVSISDQFELDETQQIRLSNIKNMIAVRQSLAEAGNDWSALAPEQREKVYQIAVNDDFTAREMARYYISAYEDLVCNPDLRTLSDDGVAVPAQPLNGTANIQLQNKMKLYPNPAMNEIAISLPGNQAATATVTDVTGRVLLKSILTGEKNHMDIRTLQPGVYFVTLQSADGKMYNSKLVKK